jgi:hypothetical protein
MNRSTKPKTAPPKPADMKRAINQLWCGVSLVNDYSCRLHNGHRESTGPRLHPRSGDRVRGGGDRLARTLLGRGATCVWSFGSVLWVTKWLLQRCLYLAPPMFEEQYQGNVSPLARSHHRSAPAFPRPRAPSPKHTGIDDRASGFSFCLSSDSHEQSQ